jgi:OmpA-OmpF porin, OOP family
MHLVDVPFARSLALVLCVAIGSWLVVSPEDAQGHVVVTDTETTILDVVEFEPGTATLLPSSQPILDAVAATLQGNPSIELVEVQSHTRGTGDERANLALSDQRAAAVVAYLVDAGVAPERLEAQGYGDTQPIDRASPAKNERISFLIVRRTPDLPD